MMRNADGTVTFERPEVRLVRAALFAIEHYADQVWDEQEVHTVSGYSVDDFRRTRRDVDLLATADDRRADNVDRIRVNLELFESYDDDWFAHERRLRALRSIMAEALSLNLPVSTRLVIIADSRGAVDVDPGGS